MAPLTTRQFRDGIVDLKSDLDRQLVSVQATVDKVEMKMDKIDTKLDRHMIDAEHRLTELEKCVDYNDRRLSVVEKKISGDHKPTSIASNKEGNGGYSKWFKTGVVVFIISCAIGGFIYGLSTGYIPTP